MLRLRRDSGASRRAAFSLAELVISIGILILMMALAGQVFTITIKSTGQATALTEVTQQLRVFEETLREDLRNVQAGQSVMLIQGNPVNAYWTQLGKDADDNGDPSDGYGHLRDLEREKLKADGTPDLATNGIEKLVEPRADILMFFAARKATSAIDPRVTSRVQQVTYGHADMGEYPADPAQAWVPSSPFPALGQPFVTPAQQWHLARRSVLLIPTALDPATTASIRKWSALIDPPAKLGLANADLLNGSVDVVSEFQYDNEVLKPYLESGVGIGENWYLPTIFGVASQPVPQFPLWSRSRMDPTPPMMMANRMGAYFMPNCASFKVEWSLDPRSAFVAGRLDRTSEVFWIDQGYTGANLSDTSDDDPLYALRYRAKQLKDSGPCEWDTGPLCFDLNSLLCDRMPLHADGSAYSLSDRFRGVACDGDSDAAWLRLSPDTKRPPNTAVFTATRPHVDPAMNDPVADDVWPAALRITVDLYDREFRLERPIRHVMVIPIGG